MTDHRDAITGQYVTAEHAKTNPDTTVSESPCAECERLRGVVHTQGVAIDGANARIGELTTELAEAGHAARSIRAYCEAFVEGSEDRDPEPWSPAAYVLAILDGTEEADEPRPGPAGEARACPTCHGTGVHAYDDHHAKPCADCCRHSQGVWQLTEHYGDLNGRWCCLAGCGFTWASRAAYEGYWLGKSDAAVDGDPDHDHDANSNSKAQLGVGLEPIVRTVGDLTARHIGKRVRVGDGAGAIEGRLLNIEHDKRTTDVAIAEGDQDVADWWPAGPHDTPVEVLR